jgi:hypothetical protein
MTLHDKLWGVKWAIQHKLTQNALAQAYEGKQHRASV